MQFEIPNEAADTAGRRRFRMPWASIISFVLAVLIGAFLLAAVQEHGHLLPKNVCFTFPRGDTACYDPHRDHMTVDY